MILSSTREIEIVRTDVAHGQYRFAIFDFDGTLSLIREGWREIMIPTMVEVLSALGTGESEADLTRLVADFVDELTGQQTIFQMIRLCEEIEARGGAPDSPQAYKQVFHDRLLAHIDRRVAGLESGDLEPHEMTVPGSHELLETLLGRGLDLYLASGTDHDYVRREAALLGIDRFFSGIYGALDNYEDFSKAKLIAQIIEENDLAGSELLGFGDGYVEIQNVAAVGGTAVGVASNEETRVGINQWKRKRLIDAGAALIVPHYEERDPLLAHLFPE